MRTILEIRKTTRLFLILVASILLGSCSMYRSVGRPGLLYSYSYEEDYDSLQRKTDHFVENTSWINRTYDTVHNSYDKGKYRKYRLICQGDSLSAGIVFIDNDSLTKIGIRYFVMEGIPFQGSMERKLYRKNRSLYDSCETCFTNKFLVPLGG